MTAFDPIHPETWPLLLTTEQVAAIFQRKPGGVAESCRRGRFLPAPMDGKPRRWRKADVLRFVEGARGGSSLRRAG